MAFDYLYNNIDKYYGGKEFNRGVIQSGEEIKWTVREGHIDQWLLPHGLVVEQQWTPKMLEREYLTDSTGTLRHRSFGFYVIALCKCATDAEIRKAAENLPVDIEIDDGTEDDAVKNENSGSNFSINHVQKRSEIIRSVLSNFIAPHMLALPKRLQSLIHHEGEMC